MPRMANFKKPSGPFVTVEGMADVTVVTLLALHTPLRPSVTRSVIRRVGSSVTPPPPRVRQLSLHTHSQVFLNGGLCTPAKRRRDIYLKSLMSGDIQPCHCSCLVLDILSYSPSLHPLLFRCIHLSSRSLLSIPPSSPLIPPSSLGA